jgi:catechol 2,3-dioxygenase-like lactoylglutathione lyase family enzyme
MRPLTSWHMSIDHVVYGTSDLDVAEEWFESSFGLRSVPGGPHDGLGTTNRIIPLGNGTFIELLAIADHAQAGGSPLGAALQARIAHGDAFLGWAVAVQDLRPIVARLGLSLAAITRQGMTAQLAGVSESLATPGVPFFIERRTHRPVRSVAPDGISWIETACDPPRLDRWLGGHTLPIRLASGDPGVRAIGVGSHELRPNSSCQSAQQAIFKHRGSDGHDPGVRFGEPTSLSRLAEG